MPRLVGLTSEYLLFFGGNVRRCTFIGLRTLVGNVTVHSVVVRSTPVSYWYGGYSVPAPDVTSVMFVSVPCVPPERCGQRSEPVSDPVG